MRQAPGQIERAVRCERTSWRSSKKPGVRQGSLAACVSRRSRRGFVYGLVVALFMSVAGACEQTVAPTEVVIEVEADSPLLELMDKLLIEVRSARADTGCNRSDCWSERFGRTLPKEQLNWPVSFPILPLGHDDKRVFEVIVRALDGNDGVLVEQRAVSGFVPGASGKLTLALEDVCRPLAEECAAGADCHGTLCSVCRQGRCEQTGLFTARDGMLQRTVVDPSVMDGSAGSEDGGSGSEAGESDSGPAPGADDDAGDATPIEGGGASDARGGGDAQDAGAIDALVPCLADAATGDLHACPAEAPFCNDGECGACSNQSFRCLGNVLSVCAAGNWSELRTCNGTACKATEGSCGSCREGTHQCDGDTSTTCLEGRWQAPAPCGDTSCSEASGECGVCRNGAHRCAGNTSQVCRDGGWVDDRGCGAVSCDTVSGLCGSCANGAQQCASAPGVQAQACVSGQWKTMSDCGGQTPACWQGACSACAEPARDCANNVPRSCVNGSWSPGSACSGGKVCSGGSCVCNLTSCGSACTDTNKDAFNCGACGHSCLNGECVGGKCQPVTLAFNQNKPSGIASNGTHVFWVASPAMHEYTIASGNTRQISLAVTQPTDCSRANGALLIHGGFVYWGNSSLCRMPLPATGAATVFSLWLAGSSALDVIAANSTDVYVVNLWDGWVESINQGRYTNTSLGFLSGGVAADDAGVYFVMGNTANGYTLLRHDPTSLGTGLATPLASGLVGGARTIAAFGGFVYFSNLDSSAAATFSIYRVPTTPGGARTTVASGQAGLGDIAVDSTGIYWTDNVANGNVMRAPLGGGPAAPIATGQANPYGIALDANAIYWTNNVSAGQVMRLAK